jgi:hypothetical protein
MMSLFSERSFREMVLFDLCVSFAVTFSDLLGVVKVADSQTRCVVGDAFRILVLTGMFRVEKMGVSVRVRAYLVLLGSTKYKYSTSCTTQQFQIRV